MYYPRGSFGVGNCPLLSGSIVLVAISLCTLSLPSSHVLKGIHGLMKMLLSPAMQSLVVAAWHNFAVVMWWRTKNLSLQSVWKSGNRLHSIFFFTTVFQPKGSSSSKGVLALHAGYKPVSRHDSSLTSCVGRLVVLHTRVSFRPCTCHPVFPPLIFSADSNLVKFWKNFILCSHLPYC